MRKQTTPDCKPFYNETNSSGSIFEGRGWKDYYRLKSPGDIRI